MGPLSHSKPVKMLQLCKLSHPMLCSISAALPLECFGLCVSCHIIEQLPLLFFGEPATQFLPQIQQSVLR